MFSTTKNCKDNTDSTCFCQDEQFISSVYGCISSWGIGNNSTMQSAINYLVGVCAPFIPANPAIVTACPSSIPIRPTPSPQSVPSMVATISGEGAQPTPTPNNIPYTTIAIPELSTTCVVPIVAFTTSTGPEGTNVVLVPSGSSGAGMITAPLSYATPTSLATYAYGPSGNFSATATSAGPIQFQGAAPKSVMPWMAGVLISFLSVIVVS
jgi:hypothetical protein